jgi:NADH-quinone oxidoreductase subunit N
MSIEVNGQFLVYIALVLVQILAYPLVGLNKSKQILNIISSCFLFLAMLGRKELLFSDQFYMGEKEIKLSLILIAFNILVSLYNGAKNNNGIKHSICSNFLLIGSLVLIGSRDLSLVYISLEMANILFIVMIGLSSYEKSQSASLKYLIQSGLIGGLFLLAIALFYGSTGTFDIYDYHVQNMQLFNISIVLFIIVFSFKVGIVPFNFWISDTFPNISSGNLASYFLISKVAVNYFFILFLMNLMSKIEIDQRSFLLIIISSLAIISAFAANIKALTVKSFKGILSHSIIAHSSYIFVTLTLAYSDSYKDNIIFYLVFYSISSTGAFITINNYLKKYDLKDSLCSFNGMFNRDPILALSLTIFILSLAGMPFTSGFTTKFVLFHTYLASGKVMVSLTLFVSAVIALAYYVKCISRIFLEDGDVLQPINIITKNKKIIIIIFCILVLLGGIAPSLYYRIIS